MERLHHGFEPKRECASHQHCRTTEHEMSYPDRRARPTYGITGRAERVKST